jgi:hypothetical protein
MLRALVSPLVLALLTTLSTVRAAEPLTERTLKLSAGEKSPAANLDDARWLEGRWLGEAFGGTTEELWTGPAAGSLAGLFRLHNDGKVVFYELMVISEEIGSLVFRLKHFNADLTGWEEKNEVQSFPLVKKQESALLFEGMSLHHDGDRLIVYLAVEHAGKPVEEIKFVYRKANAASASAP